MYKVMLLLDNNGWAGPPPEGGTGGIYPPMILARGGYPPIKLQNSVFLMGILVKSFKKVFRRQIPFFSKFVSPHIFFSGGNPDGYICIRVIDRLYNTKLPS